MKSFLTKYAEHIDKSTLANVPMIYCPKYGDDDDIEDSVYFVQKEGLNVKV